MIKNLMSDILTEYCKKILTLIFFSTGNFHGHVLFMVIMVLQTDLPQQLPTNLIKYFNNGPMMLDGKCEQHVTNDCVYLSLVSSNYMSRHIKLEKNDL